MDAWPTHCEGQDGAPEKSKGKAKDQRLERPWRYPVSEQGALSAATLRRKGRHYEWTFVSEGKSDYKLVAPDGPVEVFPPTRPRPWREPKVTELQRVEQGAHFIRTFYPDIDVQTELIRDEIAEDTRITRTLGRQDPFAGNMIAVSSFHVSRKNMAYVVFPTGETNRQLNMSPLVVNTRTSTQLKPVATPVYTFDTPIRQIIASPHAETGKGKQAPVLGVRTMGSTAFLQVKVAVNKSTYAVEPTPFITVQRADTGDRHAVDITISPSNPSIGYVVNDTGGIYRCSAPEGKRTIEFVHMGGASEQSIYRISACEARERLLFVSDKSASFLDLRAGKRSHILHAAAQPEVVLNSADSLGDEHVVRLVSNREILWIDGRNSRKPLVSVKHGRDHDMTLSTRTHVLISSTLTFLTSRRNSLVTVYDISRGNDNLVHIHDAPYALPPILRPDGPHLGHAFFQSPTLTGSKHLSIFQLSERGNVSLLNIQRLSREAADEAPEQPQMRADWPPEIQRLATDVDAARPDIGSLAGRAHSIVDLQPAYQRLFVERKKQDLSAQTDVVFDVLDSMPTFWQGTDVPVEHALTTFDIAMRSGPEPADASRNDWVTGSALDCVAGYRALGQGRVPRDELARKAAWHLDISPFIRRTVHDYGEDSHKTLENLSRYDLADGPGRTAASFRTESEARSQLALDLLLASDVFAPKRPGKGPAATLDEDLLNISRSTEAMSLGDVEAPPVHFSFLRPICKSDPRGLPSASENVIGELAAKSMMPPGVRLLLQEWDVGADPMQYEYRHPYDEAAAPPANVQRPSKAPPPQNVQPAQEPRPSTQTQTQRPPAIASSVPKAPSAISASQPPVPRRPLAAARSHEAFVAPTPRPPPSRSQPADTWSAPASSQEFMASTQVLPGPHGGRPVPAKKKGAKKRLGGF